MDWRYWTVSHHPPLRMRVRFHPRRCVRFRLLPEQTRIHQRSGTIRHSVLHHLCRIYQSHGPICFHHLWSWNYLRYMSPYPHLGTLQIIFALSNTDMQVPNVIGFPAQKRAVAIAFVNGMGNCASIYGVFLWPKTDAPRYIPGFSATTVFMGLIVVLAQVMAFLIRKYPNEVVDGDEAVAREIERKRQEGLQIPEGKGHA